MMHSGSYAPLKILPKDWGWEEGGGGGRGAYENLTYGGESENSPSNKCMHE